MENLVWKTIWPSFKKMNLKRRMLKDLIKHTFIPKTLSLDLKLRRLCKKTTFNQTLPFMLQSLSSRVQTCASTFWSAVCLFGLWAVTQPRILWEYTKTIFLVTVLCFCVSRFCPNFHWQFIQSSSHIFCFHDNMPGTRTAILVMIRKVEAEWGSNQAYCRHHPPWCLLLLCDCQSWHDNAQGWSGASKDKKQLVSFC